MKRSFRPSHDDRRDFLLRVSVLDSFCAELVALLTEEPNPQVVLEELEREPMFLVPLDTRRRWFRFHHLFRDMLRFRLRAEQPETETRLLNQAASLASRARRCEFGRRVSASGPELGWRARRHHGSGL